jgi:GNAT superfamily N-acetyltransferase
MHIHLRLGRPDERGALEDLQRRASLIYEEDRPHLLANPETIELPRWQLEQQRVRVAETGAGPAGFSVVLPRTPDIADLDGLFVEPRLWRGGIGRALLEDVVTQALLAGVRVLEVLGNPRAEGFYRKLGFVALGQVEMQFGPGIRMRRLL